MAIFNSYVSLLEGSKTIIAIHCFSLRFIAIHCNSLRTFAKGAHLFRRCIQEHDVHPERTTMICRRYTVNQQKLCQQSCSTNGLSDNMVPKKTKWFTKYFSSDNNCHILGPIRNFKRQTHAPQMKVFNS